MKDGVDANDGGEGVRIDVDAETWDMRINSTVQELWLFELMQHVKDGLSTPARFNPACIKMQTDTLSRIGGMVATPDTTPAKRCGLWTLSQLGMTVSIGCTQRSGPSSWQCLYTQGGSHII